MDVNKLAANMISAAAAAASTSWNDIKDVAVHEFSVLAQRIASIGAAVGTGMSLQTARLLFKNARSQIVAVLAMLSTMLAAMAEKIVRAALNVVKAAVNTSLGFALIP